MLALKRTVGFTIVELIVVIAILGILTTIGIISYGGWRESVTQNAIKSDLTTAAQAMESERNFGTGYPTSLPSSFTPSDDVTITWTSGDATSFCLDGTAADTSSTFYIDSLSNEGPKSGTCASRVVTTPITSAPTSVTAILNTSSGITVGWASLSGATSYTAQCASDAAFIINPNSSTTTSTTTSVNGLVPGTIYCRVQGQNAAGGGPWSPPITASADITDGLIAWWRFNGNALDSVGSNNGTVSGASLTAGQNGQANSAYRFDGINDYIEVSPTLTDYNNLSISLWARVVGGASATNGYGYIIHQGPNNTQGDSAFWIAGKSGAAPLVYSGDVSGFSDITERSTITASDTVTWRLITMVYNGTIRSIYVDGDLEVSAVRSFTNSTTGNRLGIGSAPSSPSHRPSKGDIDDVRIYNRALSSNEVSQLFAAGAR